MKIAFFSPIPFSKKLGATKNRLELAEALRELGWSTDLIDSKMLGLTDNASQIKNEYRIRLKEYLIEGASRYDVILYEYDTLPFERSLFSESTLLVARPALVDFHHLKIKIPYDLKTHLSNIVRKTLQLTDRRKYMLRQKEKFAREESLRNCDLIQVQNSIDSELMASKYPQKQILLIPNGIAKDRFTKFQSIQRNYQNLHDKPVIAFVGTFDYRKGAMDFLYIIAKIQNRFRGVTFKFIGARGLFRSTQSILNFFPYKLRKHIEIVLEFEPDDLPLLLADCHIGVFPSYFESFGFGALEMMCSGLPVVGYKSPGPNDFLLRSLQVDVGDKSELVKKILDLLDNPNFLSEKSAEARKATEKYQWHLIAKEADSAYKKILYAKRN
ncbi:glycosyltransferase [Parapedobacter sp. ISTM3]|uniref:glycosyltransferase family 4 protein n=1 Tax=Parapedobacter sp. ISTM3 TaxID=2800130 RepID=UPI00190903A4|nr:glycosyltransferase [Parapedobacter sp. ISTM3]MBK1441654.1 glycosyltransferase [Parapedobacter sp. ISTM3]